MKQGDIVLLSVPFSDQSSSKVRPAVVVSNNQLNNSCDDLVLVPITSVIKEAPYSVFIEQKSLASGKLIVPSRIRADKPFTAHNTLVKLKIGHLTDTVFEQVTVELFKVFVVH